MKKALLMGLLLILVTGLVIGCSGDEEEDAYNYITNDEFVQRLDKGDADNEDMIIVSSQTEEEWATGYLPEAIATHARPLETDEDYAKLDDALAQIEQGEMDVILICPRGGSGARRPFDYFEENGVDTDRMFILEGGQEQMNKDYPEYVVFQD